MLQYTLDGDKIQDATAACLLFRIVSCTYELNPRFDTEAEARFIFHLITSGPSLEFLESMIFWDEKRPITVEILRRLSLKAVAAELDGVVIS